MARSAARSLWEKELGMSEKTTANNDNRGDHQAQVPTPLKREEPALRWPSASTSGGGAYIPSHDDATAKSEA